MLVEFTHRLTSGLTLPLVIVLVVWAWRAFSARKPSPLGSWIEHHFDSSRGLGCAALVLLGLVAQNDSMERALVIAIHLTNTFMAARFTHVNKHFGHLAPVRRH